MKLRACVLEDDELIRSLVRTLLEMRGYQVEAYSDPTEYPLPVRKLYAKNEKYGDCIDVLITDINMPRMDGFSFLDQLDEKQIEVGSIGLMSGSWTKTYREKAEQSGYRIFHKPFDIREMNEWLAAYERKISGKTTSYGVA